VSLLSIVVPVRDEAACLAAFWERLRAVLRPLSFDFEVIFVDDASRDQTWNRITRLHGEEPRVKGIRLAQHRGQQAALFLGLQSASGDGVITLDGDLQHPPERIPDFIRAWQEGAELVYGFKTIQRGRGFFQTLIHRAFNRILALRSGLSFHPETSNFQLLDKTLVSQVVESWNPSLFLRGWIHRKAQQKQAIPFEARQRFQGKTKYSTFTLCKLGLRYLWFFPAVSRTGLAGRKNSVPDFLSGISESIGFQPKNLGVP